MAASRRKQDDKNLEILRELISVNGNKYCLDCNQRGPTYVNTTIGSFVCSKCSGMLRGLTPPHRVKSISMATFTPEEMEFIKTRGNDFCRRVWLGLYEGESVNYADEQSVKDFMSDKYEKKRYYLESSANNTASTNGVSGRNKSKNKSGSVNASSTPLISISPQTSKSVSINSFSNSPKTANTLLPAVNETSYKLARPVNNFVPQQNFLSNCIAAPAVATVPAAAPTPVPDFPVDFSTANIYNSSQHNNNNINNNFVSQSTGFLTAFNFNATPSQNTTSNDRYAALADLDHAFREQNMKATVPEETSSANNMNPFQSATTSDFFANKNPFSNGGWSGVPVNPFMPSTNSGFSNSKNPFL